MPKVASIFGLSEASFVTPGPTPVYSQIIGVQEASIEVEMETTEVTGDDKILTFWNHGQTGTLSLKGAIVDLDVIAEITGNSVITDSGPPVRDYIYGGTESELNPPEFMLRIRQEQAKHPNTGVPCVHQIYLFRCIGKITLTGIKYGETTGIEIEAKLLQSDHDEKLQTITPAMYREEFIEV